MTVPAGPRPVLSPTGRSSVERQFILDWGRTTGLMLEIVQQYRFARRQGASCAEAHVAASRPIELSAPSIADPMTIAGVMLEWAELEHRSWFWRCCRDDHFL